MLETVLNHPVVSRHIPTFFPPKSLGSVSDHTLGCAVESFSCLSIVIVSIEVPELYWVCLALNDMHLFYFLGVWVELICRRLLVQLFDDILALHDVAGGLGFCVSVDLFLVEQVALVWKLAGVKASLLSLPKNRLHGGIFELDLWPVNDFWQRLRLLNMVLKIRNLSCLFKISSLAFDHLISESISNIKLLLKFLYWFLVIVVVKVILNCQNCAFSTGDHRSVPIGCLVK